MLCCSGFAAVLAGQRAKNVKVKEVGTLEQPVAVEQSGRRDEPGIHTPEAQSEDQSVG